MSDFDFEADLAALLAPSEPALASPQPDHQEAAAAAPDLDLMALLDPTQAAPESVAPEVQADDFTVSQAPASQAEESAAIARVRQIAELRAQLLAQIEDAKRRGVRHDDSRLYFLRLRWFCLRWEALKAARDGGLIPRPPSPVPQNWTVPDPFQLLEEANVHEH